MSAILKIWTWKSGEKKGRNIYPNEVFISSAMSGLQKDSLVLCHQIRTIDKKRLIRKLGEIEDDEIKADINSAICFQLGIS